MLDLLPLAQHLEKIAKQNVEAKTIPIPGVDYATFINRPTEGLSITHLLPSSVKRQLAFWTDFLAYVASREDFYGKPCAAVPSDNDVKGDVASDGAVVLIGKDGATYTEQPENLRGVKASISFIKSAAWLFLSQPQPIQQKELVAKLRINMRGTGEEMLLAKTRKMKFSTGAEGNGDIQHGRASVSRAAREEVFADEGAYPETYTFSVKLFDNGPELSKHIQCAIEVSAINQSITIIPFPGEMEAAFETTLAEMGDMLPESLPCYRVA